MKRSTSLQRYRHGAARLVAATAVPALLWAADTHALPVGAQVVNGNVTVAPPQGATLIITQGSPKAIVNWRGFSIAGGETVTIRQAPTDVLLNRVIGNDMSVIAGRLSADGRVLLVNPAGVMFTQGASVSAGALVASTLNISDPDFLAGRYRFASATGMAAAVVNQGHISATQGGTVALLGGQVNNTGTVSAQLGTVAFGAGTAVTLDFAGDGLTTLQIDRGAVEALIDNGGAALADGGQVVMSAQNANDLAATVINQHGLVRAKSLVNRDGHIVLDGGSAGVTEVAGMLDASGADGQKGGRIDVTGDDVALLAGAQLDASGPAGGGTVRFGGGSGGSDSSIRNAQAIWMSPAAQINADALSNGPGGQIVAYGIDAARLYGTLSARGGSQGGAGGTIETSAHYLDTTGLTVDTLAARGAPGTWIIDPFDVTIANTVSDNEVSPTGSNPVTFNPVVAGSVIFASVLDQQLANSSVLVTTGTGGTGAGAITINAPILKSAGNNNVTLTLRSAGSITDSASITATTGTLNLVFDTTAATGGQISIGVGPLTSQPVSRTLIDTNGGYLHVGTLNGGTTGFDNATVTITNTTIDTRVGAAVGTPGAQGGDVVIHATGYAPPEFVFGGAALDIDNSTINTATGGVELMGVVGTGDNVPLGGIVLQNSAGALGAPSSVSTTSGKLVADGAGEGPEGIGVALLDGASLNTSGGGTISVNGAVTVPSVTAGTTNVDQSYGTLIFNGSINATAPGSTVQIAGSTNTSDPGVGIGLVPFSSARTRGTGSVTAGQGGSITVLASNDGTTSSFVARTNAGNISTPGGTFAAASARVDPVSFARIWLDAVPITLFGTGAGLNIDATTFLALAPTLGNLAFGTTSQTGLITVDGTCTPIGNCTPVKPVFNENLTLAAGGANNAGFAMPLGISIPGHILAIDSGTGPAVVTGGIQAAGLLLAGPANFTFTDPGNSVGVLAMVGTGSVVFSNPGSFSIGALTAPVYNTAAGALTTLDGTQSTLTGSLRAQSLDGSIQLGALPGQTTNLSAGPTVDLIMENGVFTNEGSGRITTGDAWHIWASTWQGETRGGLDPGNPLANFYGCSFAGGCSWGGTVPLATNHFVYVAQPSVTVAANDQSRQLAFPNPQFTFGTTGLVNGDTASGTLQGAFSTTATQASPVGSYPITGSFSSLVGYKVSVLPATLTVTAQQTGTGVGTGGVTPPITPITSSLFDRSGLQPMFAEQEQTFVYESNLGSVPLCITSAQPVLDLQQPQEPADTLAVEWQRVHTRPNLNNCLAIQNQHSCSEF